MAVLWACGPVSRPLEGDPGAGSPEELGSSFNVRVEGDTVHFEVHVTNVTDRPLVLEFGSAQRYDVEVRDDDGDAVWQWSADRVFAQVVGREDLAAGASMRFTTEWLGAEAGEEYVATGRLTSMNYPVELRTRFRVPGE